MRGLSCGGMQVKKLRATGHRVLIYSQFTMVLDILEDWLAGRGWPYFRLDGDVGVCPASCMPLGAQMASTAGSCHTVHIRELVVLVCEG